MGAQNKDFGAVSQTVLNKLSLVSSVAQAMQSHAHAFHVSRERNVVAPDKLLLIFTSNVEE